MLNTLNIIKKQINKERLPLRDAQIGHTAYRGVDYDVIVQHQKKFTVLSATVVTFHNSEGVMQALQVAGFGTLFSIVFIGLLYGELILLHKFE